MVPRLFHEYCTTNRQHEYPTEKNAKLVQAARPINKAGNSRILNTIFSLFQPFHDTAGRPLRRNLLGQANRGPSSSGSLLASSGVEVVLEQAPTRRFEILNAICGARVPSVCETGLVHRTCQAFLEFESIKSEHDGRFSMLGPSFFALLLQIQSSLLLSAY